MKVKELLEQIEIQEAGTTKQKLGALAMAGALALGSPGGQYYNADDQVPNFPVHQMQHRVPGQPYYKIGAPYEKHGEKFTPEYDPNYKETGVASWYGPGFDGKLTANGDKFDTEHTLMAAHPTLPLPSKAWVTNLDNGKKIMVTVTDRGPYAKGRLIDLSKKAAEELGYLHKGTAHVKVEYDPKATEEYLKNAGLYDQFLKVAKPDEHKAVAKVEPKKEPVKVAKAEKPHKKPTIKTAKKPIKSTKKIDIASNK